MQEVYSTKQNFFIIQASYVVALCIAKAKKPHAIADQGSHKCWLEIP